VVPEGFEAYCRVFHPEGPIYPDGSFRSWTEIAEGNGRIAHPNMQFHMINRPVPLPIRSMKGPVRHREPSHRASVSDSSNYCAGRQGLPTAAGSVFGRVTATSKCRIQLFDYQVATTGSMEARLTWQWRRSTHHGTTSLRTCGGRKIRHSSWRPRSITHEPTSEAHRS
jgi:hypothetical protein